MRKKGDAMKAKIVHKEEPNSSIPSETPSAKIHAVACEKADKARTNCKSELRKKLVSLRVIQNEEEEEPSLPSLPKERLANQPAFTSFIMKTRPKPKKIMKRIAIVGGEDKLQEHDNIGNKITLRTRHKRWQGRAMMTSRQEENNEEENKDATHQSKKEPAIEKDEPRQEETEKDKKDNVSNINLPPRKNPRGKLVTKKDAPVTQEGCTVHNEEQYDKP